MAEDLPKVRPVGDSCVLVEYEEVLSPDVNQKVRQLAYGIEKHALPGIGEVVPAYRSLMVFFDPLFVELEKISDFIVDLSKDSFEVALPQPRLLKLPTVYGGVHGPDLDRVSEYTKLTPGEVVHIFSSQAYLIYFLGFLCALAYLGGVPETLEVPRLDSPRPLVLTGSVGIGGRQATIYPVDMPSGFNYIGRTFVRVYDPQTFPPTLMRPGDYIQFPSVPEEEARSAASKDLRDFIEGL